MAVVWECLVCKQRGYAFFYEDYTWLQVMDIVLESHSEKTGCRAPNNKIVMCFDSRDNLAFTKKGVTINVGA